MISEALMKNIFSSQKNEITENVIYNKLALVSRDVSNREVLEKIAGDELKHYDFWKKFTLEDIKPDKFKIFYYILISKVFGLTFTIKLLENNEKGAQEFYSGLAGFVEGSKFIIEDERRHESELIAMIKEDRLKYVSSMVLGINDALVELTGTLAGFSLVFQKTITIAVAGLITGIAASLSMAASEYLSAKSEGDKSKSPFRASVYTGIVYLATVLILISPYLILKSPIFCILLVILFTVLIIFVFTFYVSVAQGLSFRRRFVEMTAISLGVASVSFALGYVVRVCFNIQI